MSKSIISYYKDIFQLKRYGGFSLAEINAMYPYEMEIYTMQVILAMKEENDKKK